MEETDLALEQRVWQRIGTGQCCLNGMRLRCLEQAAVLRRLSQSARGSRRETLLRLAAEEIADAEAIAGMLQLSGQSPEAYSGYAPRKESDRRMLAGACRTACQAVEEYEAQDGEFAPVFDRMARRLADRIHDLLRLM